MYVCLSMCVCLCLHITEQEQNKMKVPNTASLSPVLFRYDYVEVRDGVDESGQLVGKYCGKIAPSPVVSSGNQLFIKFVSDYETHGAGFSIRYEIFKTGGWPSTAVVSLYPNCL